jgi:carbonic anhydrase/acetyltransferase-like protein (isoleucine patch superfamily)
MRAVTAQEASMAGKVIVATDVALMPLAKDQGAVNDPTCHVFKVHTGVGVKGSSYQI